MKVYVLTVKYYQMGDIREDLVCIFSSLDKAKEYIEKNIDGRLEINDRFKHCTYYKIVKFSDHDTEYSLNDYNLNEPI